VSRAGACPCGAVRYSVTGPVRDVIVCHCKACRAATGGAWEATAARREDLVVEDDASVTWERAAVSAHGASRGRCRSCGTTVFWSAPGRDTVSFGVATLADPSGLEVAAHIWVDDAERRELLPADVPVAGGGLPASVAVPWRA